jgi:hypothetical protein
MSAQESTVDIAMDAMPQNIDDRLLESMKAFYRQELGELPARKVCGWPSLEVLTRFNAYQDDVHENWEKRYQAAEERHAEVKRAREEERRQRGGGFWNSLKDFAADAAGGIGHMMSLPSEPNRISDEEALVDINLVQRYLRSVTQPGMKPLNLPPTVGRVLEDIDEDSLQNTVVYNHLNEEWGRRGVEEIASMGNDQIYREVTKGIGNLDTEDEQAYRKDIKVLMPYLRQANGQQHNKHKRR